MLELTCMRSGAGQTVEVRGAGALLATCDDAGTIAGGSGESLLSAPLVWDGPRDQGTSAKLDVSDAPGTPLGEVRITKYSFGPRTSKATLSLRSPGGEVARFEPDDGKGEEVAIFASGARAGTLRRTGRKRGLLRSSTTYRLELTGPLDGPPRALVLAAALRYQKLLVEAAAASQRPRAQR